jgi:hypothetical protein
VGVPAHRGCTGRVRVTCRDARPSNLTGFYVRTDKPTCRSREVACGARISEVGHRVGRVSAQPGAVSPVWWPRPRSGTSRQRP